MNYYNDGNEREPIDFIEAAFYVFLGTVLIAFAVALGMSKATAAPTDAQVIEMMRRQYENDIKTDSGRAKWHGKMTAQIINTNELIRIDVYEDGTTFTNKWQSRTTSAMIAQQKRMAAMTNNVPARLAAARLRREEEKQAVPKEVTVEKTIGAEGGAK